MRAYGGSQMDGKESKSCFNGSGLDAEFLCNVDAYSAAFN